MKYTDYYKHTQANFREQPAYILCQAFKDFLAAQLENFSFISVLNTKLTEIQKLQFWGTTSRSKYWK